MTNGKVQPADYSYWLMVKNWDYNEAAYLLLGIEPRSLPYTDLSEDQQKAKEQHEKLSHVFSSAVKAGDFGKVIYADEGRTINPPISGLDWVSWAKRNGIECAEGLLAAVSELDQQKDTDEEVLHPRLKASLYLIIGALLQELKENTGDSQAKIIEQIADLHVLKSGLSKSNLEYHFAEANRYLNTW